MKVPLTSSLAVGLCGLSFAMRGLCVMCCQMHDNKYLHLPVVDESSGNVVGVVGVMEIILATAGEQGSTGYGIKIDTCEYLWRYKYSLRGVGISYAERLVGLEQLDSASTGQIKRKTA